MKKVLFSILIGGLIFASCKKSDSSSCAKTVAGIAGSYKLTAETTKNSSTGTIENDYDSLDVCEKDDVLAFNANGTFTYTDAGIVCSSSGNDSGVWTVRNDSIIINAVYGRKLISNNCKVIVTESSFSVLGTTYTNTSTYTKQ